MRADYKEAQGARFSLRGFHDTVLGLGGLPLHLQAQSLLGEPAGALLG